MKLNRHRLVLAVFVAWTVAGFVIFSRWSTVASYLSVLANKAGLKETAPNGQTTMGRAETASQMEAELNSPPGRSGSNKSSQPWSQFGPIRVTSLSLETGDSLALRVEDMTSRFAPAPNSDDVLKSKIEADEPNGDDVMLNKTKAASVNSDDVMKNKMKPAATNRNDERKMAWMRERDGGEGMVERVNTSGLGRTRGWTFLSQLVQQGRLDFRVAAKFPVVDEYLTDMEREILADGPVTDLTTVASPDTSLLVLDRVNPTRTVTVGENVTVRVVVKDAKGRPVSKGGHQVRVWMVGKEKITRSAAVDVTDLRNGTYVASLPVLWPGLFEVRAALQRPREFVRLALTLMGTMKMMNEIIASFVSGAAEEVTLCSFIPVVPGYPEVCNLTSLNSGLPWYCGRPSTPGLRCVDWSWSSHTLFPQRYPLSGAESELMEQFATQHSCTRTLRQKLLLTAVQDLAKRKSGGRKACQPLKPRETWEDQSPRGYWERNTWRPLTGCPLPKLNRSTIFECLHDTHVICMGDSNAIRILNSLQAVTRCAPQPDPQVAHHPNMLHVPITFRCRKPKLVLSWYPHAYPFFTGAGMWSDSRVKNAPSHLLDSLPATGNYVIVIHLYIHFSQVHTFVYARHVRDTARAVRDLLRRNARVKVFIRGPHAVGGSRFCILSDVFTRRCLRVLSREFRDLRQRVVMLNTWDMTVADQNCDVHPGSKVPEALCRTILSQSCPPQPVD